MARGTSDDRLVARLRAGDERAFEIIYDRYHQPLLAFCRHMLGSREEAEDALQQVFASGYRALLGDEREIQLKPWLYALARNRCLSVLRARRTTVPLEAVVEPSTDGLLVAGEVERRADLKHLLGDIAQLAEDQRAALLLAELGDLSHEQIGEALDVPRDKVKALIYQARTSLMSYRKAREADCETIQQELASLRGGALRRIHLSRHVSICSRCAAFKQEVQRQRTGMAMLLPVVPGTMLKGGILASILGGGSGVAASSLATSAAGSSLLAGGIVAKGLAVAALATTTAGGGYVVVERLESRPPAQPKPATAQPAIGAAQSGAAAGSRPQGGSPSSSRRADPKAVGQRSSAAVPPAQPPRAADAERGRSAATAPGQVRKSAGVRGKPAEAPGRGLSSTRPKKSKAMTKTRSAARPKRSVAPPPAATARGNAVDKTKKSPADPLTVVDDLDALSAAPK